MLANTVSGFKGYVIEPLAYEHNVKLKQILMKNMTKNAFIERFIPEQELVP